MPHNVFHHHDGVVHQDPDGEDQREQGDPVEGESVEIKDQQRQRESGGNGDGHHQGFPPPQHQQDQDRHAHHRDAHVEEQLVGFLRRGLAVVAGNGHLDIIRRESRALHRIDFFQDRLRQGNGVGAGALGNGDGDGVFLVADLSRGRRAAPKNT